MPKKIELVVLDMAGTTVRDNNEVENCFLQAADRTGITVTRKRINAMMGWSKKFVFETLWKEIMPNASDHEVAERVNHSYQIFKEVLEKHYLNADVLPTNGCVELLNYLHTNNIKIAFTTGFYREVTDIILDRLKWKRISKELPASGAVYDVSITSDQVIAGRPAPFMIFKAMEHCEVIDVRKVVKIGDTPSDLLEGKNAGCLYSFGITNGTHTHDELSQFENDGLFENLGAFMQFLSKNLN